MNQIRSNSTPANIQNTTLSSTPSTQANQATQAPAATAHYLDPLAVLERQLLARPGSHGHHHHRHQTGTQVSGHLAPPSSGTMSKSRTPSPEPTPAARRCMAATAAWIPMSEGSPGINRPFFGAIERRQSWDGQEYRHAMMLQGTSLECACHPNEHTPNHNWHSRHHEISVPPQNSYEADRGFSEGSH
ncbi:hypothetical protein F503_02670 [Ophiostoma piceae UAMH 11346]|uniref:Uncharacterized protein n=1 Tax=Ophiostoma piceae (strain UAMH 11346) TaxID=1262450 RepID=S3C1B6_OPHP1|nr:hypothetical protein F503_02670 [Ophiostoma piceae UAMH 11346]